MVAIHVALIAVFMAGRTAECRSVVSRVAFAAGVPLILEPMFGGAVDRETIRCVDVVHRAEGRGGRPRCLRMTGEAVVAEIQRLVVGRCRCSREVALMTLIAIGVRELVVPVGMAIHTGYARMGAGKREVGVCVGES